jgi:hypothetical protein
MTGPGLRKTCCALDTLKYPQRTLPARRARLARRPRREDIYVTESFIHSLYPHTLPARSVDKDFTSRFIAIGTGTTAV